jgi:hypothetical protein
MKRRVGTVALVTTVMLALTGVLAASANAAATATTVVAAQITQTSATLYGVVETGGAATNWQFEYGTSTAYAKTTAVQAIPAGKGNVVVSAPVSGLKPGTTYHFQLLAQNNSGPPSYTVTSSGGGDQTFATLAATPGILSLRNPTPVVHKDKTAFLFLRCGTSSPATNACNGSLRIATRVVVSGKPKGTVTCVKASFRIPAGHTKRITVKVTKACIALLGVTRGHRVVATLKATWSGGRLTRGITLIRA